MSVCKAGMLITSLGLAHKLARLIILLITQPDSVCPSALQLQIILDIIKFAISLAH